VIVLVRHGRTAANASGMLLGRADPGLDDEGTRQVAALATACAGLDVARVVTSPLARCRATADAIAAATAAARPPGDAPRPDESGARVPVEVDERWIELDYGDLDGRPVGDVPAATWGAWRADVSWRPPGGESLAELGARVRSACGDLVAEAAGRDVIVVTHVSPIKAAIAWALEVGDEVAWRMWVAPASISRITVSGDRPVLRAFNEVAHLEPKSASGY
jgi:broad specificity phosphatase PhoE